MSIPIYNPNRFPNVSDPIGAIIGVSDGQMHEVVQPNGIVNGEVVFKPPEALLDGVGVFDGMPALLPGLSDKAILSLNAKDAAGNAIFTAGIIAGQVLPCLLRQLGIVRTTIDRIPPRTKVGVYDPANPVATRFNALNITRYDNLGGPVARDHITVLEVPSGVTVLVGDLVMGGWSAAGHYPNVVPIWPTVEKLSGEVVITGGAIATTTNVDSWLTELIVLADDTSHASLIDADTILTPGVNSSSQIAGAVDGTSDCIYTYNPFGNLLSEAQLLRLSLGKVVAVDSNSQKIGVDLSKVS